ncbi:hypothetical protein KEJ39_08325 [Candidatus Bathyarchaeota archaeon]|nr:hypothetical protein [Candidatus Bathyarchaeota archaeon]
MTTDREGATSAGKDVAIARVKASPTPKPTAKIERKLVSRVFSRGCLVKKRYAEKTSSRSIEVTVIMYGGVSGFDVKGKVVQMVESNTTLADMAKAQLNQPRKSGPGCRRSLFAATRSGIKPPVSNARELRKSNILTCQP